MAIAGQVAIPWSGVNSPLENLARLRAWRKDEQGQNARRAWGALYSGTIGTAEDLYHQAKADQAAENDANRQNIYLKTLLGQQQGDANTTATPKAQIAGQAEQPTNYADPSVPAPTGSSDQQPSVKRTASAGDVSEEGTLGGPSDQSPLSRMASNILAPFRNGRTNLDSMLDTRAKLAAQAQAAQLARGERIKSGGVWADILKAAKGKVPTPAWMQAAYGLPATMESHEPEPPQPSFMNTVVSMLRAQGYSTDEIMTKLGTLMHPPNNDVQALVDAVEGKGAHGGGTPPPTPTPANAPVPGRQPPVPTTPPTLPRGRVVNPTAAAADPWAGF